MPSPTAVLPLSKKLAEAEKANDLPTRTSHVGYSQLQTPARILGSMMFAKNTITSSELEVTLPDTIDKERLTVLMWFQVIHFTNQFTLIVMKLCKHPRDLELMSRDIFFRT